MVATDLSREGRALEYQALAEREALRQPSLAGVTPRTIEEIAVIGAGTMGSGIAIAALDAGFFVVLLEQDHAALARGWDRIHNHYAGRVQKEKRTSTDAAQREERLRATTDWDDLASADLVIEAVFEELDVKREVFARIDRIAKPDAVLATNTSYLDVDAIARATSRPEAVIGLHFFSPANVMRLVEVVRGAASTPVALATGLAVAGRMRKLPVIAGNAFGFIGNRVFSAYRRQCEFMIEEGASPAQVDAALQSFGFAMGAFAVADLAGLDIAWRIRKSQAATRDRAARYVHIPDRLCEAGRLGRKTGAGYYRYESGGKEPLDDPFVSELIERCGAEKGIVRRALTDLEIQRRALLTMVNEAALLVGVGVAERATDVDVVLANGYGFPRGQGGPVFWARAQAPERGRDALERDLDWLAEKSGPGFVRGDVRHLMEKSS